VLAQGAQEGVAIHLRHVDVDHVQVEGMLAFCAGGQRRLQRLQPVAGFAHGVAGVLEDGPFIQTDGGSIVHDEDMFHACSNGFW
jgi:hypothetical protein